MFACEADRLGLILSWVIPKTLKWYLLLFLFNAQHLRAAQRIKKQSMDYTAVKEKLLQSWCYKTLAVIKRHKTTYLDHYLSSTISMADQIQILIQPRND